MLSLNSFQALTRGHQTFSFDYIQPILHSLGDPELEIQFAIQVLKQYSPVSSFVPEHIITEGINLCGKVNNLPLECEWSSSTEFLS
jgi:hypothetical protein